MKQINSLSGISDLKELVSPQKKAGEESFADYFSQAWQGVNKDLTKADKAIEEFASGSKTSLHEVMIVAEKANINFQLLAQVRNKLMEAYREVMRMQF